MTTNQQSVDAYLAVHDRMVALARAMAPEQEAVVVPAAPEWQVRDLLAHAAGTAADVIAGKLEGAGSDPWTATQVDARRDHDVETILAEWSASLPALTDALLAAPPVQAAQVVFDITTHEHDLRGALGIPGERDSDGVAIGWGWATDIVAMLRDGAGSGALEVTTEHGVEVFGSGAPTARVSAGRFELWRAMTGRRSPEQVRAWTWDGEPTVEAVCLLPPRATPLEE